MGVLFSWRQRAPRAPQAALPRTDEDVRQLLSLLPRYRVLLYNDDVHDMEYVVQALLHTIPTLSEGEAMRVMLGAHLNGVSEVLVCPKELAEHYRDRLAGYGLGCDIEPA
ncbi:MAG TPA: ATP-dependent Clp protease adaptor ClpS [Ktedonobacterales bacterium]|nr:ATP-dependent Clp protease adaptor ClpS [Ktedonobacterales bacterium]